jgi:hypothetical protein
VGHFYIYEFKVSNNRQSRELCHSIEEATSTTKASEQNWGNITTLHAEFNAEFNTHLKSSGIIHLN